ncbi:MerR family transcriptional regulator [Staphylococcus saprophyticus]|nr:MerR family transcriptional regulator [Staphylococcus saprophyticus]MDT3920237.1 MerR family transcriptional regulator [Staphylococcus saprophyticus]MDT3966757.1 MerR family transcriptional regulator [Staphylococcus saprophyticus]MDT3978999.1 MerR family transcriptional regulator [Staphylococcus saprophyticus]MDT3987212.1 MerR family transcriptional regulator [Staphylococcus saprophyticus]MDT3997792.1 MerR family transcriptional regulator [Staphylococcus saprophyticus]
MYIKDVAQKTNLEPHTIRYYEQEGLLPFIERDEHGYRVFKESDLGWFDFINCLKITGMSINDLRKIITMTVNGEKDFDSRRKILLDHKKVLEQQQEALDKAFNKVDVKLQYFNDLEKEYEKNSQN